MPPPPPHTHTGSIVKSVGDGASVKMSIAEWLAAADTSLEETNTIAEGLTAGVHPFYRMTGMVVSVRIKCGNRRPL